MDKEIDEDDVLDHQPEREKLRPDCMSIAKSIARNHGLSSTATSSAIDRLHNKAAIHMQTKKTQQGISLSSFQI